MKTTQTRNRASVIAGIVAATLVMVLAVIGLQHSPTPAPPGPQATGRGFPDPNCVGGMIAASPEKSAQLETPAGRFDGPHPTLRRRLKLAGLAALDQRISTRYTSTGMVPSDNTDYIRGHLKYAGRSDPLFSDDAITAIHQASRGYPRAVNNLAVASLIATYAANKSIVDLGAAQSAITENSE